ncbi:MAG: hypothetical protein ABGY42_17215, partial [bacterium]
AAQAAQEEGAGLRVFVAEKIITMVPTQPLLLARAAAKGLKDLVVQGTVLEDRTYPLVKGRK